VIDLSRVARATTAALALATTASLCSACDIPLIGDGRSVESFCSTYWDQKEAYLDKYATRSQQVAAAGEQDPLLGVIGGLGSSIEAMGDVVIIFEKLDKVAPDDIEPDVAAIRDALKESVNNAGEAVSNPLAALAGGLMSGLATMGSWQRLGDYVVTNCGEKG
jgi:hypothetical protein